MAYGGYNKETISEVTIILEGYKEILKNCNCEMRGGYNNSILSGNNVLNEYVPDTRAVFSESVEGLSNALFPFFDKDMKTAIKEYDKKIEELYVKYGKDGVITGDENNAMFSISRLRASKKLYRELSSLLHRLGYLKQKRMTIGMEEMEDEVGVEYE